MSTNPENDTPRERLLADLYVQLEAQEDAPDRARAVERFMQTRAVLLRRRRRRTLPATLSRVAAVAACALSAALVSSGWRGLETEREPAVAPAAPTPVVSPQATAVTPSEAELAGPMVKSRQGSPSEHGPAVAPAAPSPRVAASEPTAVTPSEARLDTKRSSLGVEEITVTARKREENLQSTPVSVTAFSAEDLKDVDVRRLNEITRSVPSLQFDNAVGTANSARIYLRGVGTGDPISSDDPGVGVYVDGVYLPRAQGALLSLSDVERVEVLRAPQATLFGKNTVGGAVSIVAERPDGDELAANGEIRLGNFLRFDRRSAGRVFFRLAPDAVETQLLAGANGAPSAPVEQPKARRPAPLDLASPVQLAAPSAERVRELEAQRGNDMADVLPPLGSETVDPCATPERVGAAVPDGATEDASRNARCPRVER